MRLALISPAEDLPDERRILKALFSAGLDRYHLRKPSWDREKTRRWLAAAPATWRKGIVVHGHPDLAAEFGLGGTHWKDREAPASPPRFEGSSRACHSPETLRLSLGRYASVLYGPVFPSISKPGHGPTDQTGLGEVAALLLNRPEASRGTLVYAVGGLSLETLPECQRMGFDGAALLGAVWQAADPLAAFRLLSEATLHHAA